MSTVPQDVRALVTKNLYQILDQLHWEELSIQQKSLEYSRFVESPHIGGLLNPYLSADRIRVWLKDSPVKEYGRALEGAGPYTRYTNRAYAPPETVVRSALGTEWRIRPRSISEKPMRCMVDSQSSKQSHCVIWGSIKTLKDLVWQAVLYRSEFPEHIPFIIITRRNISPIPIAEKRHAQLVCDVVGAKLFDVQRPVVLKNLEGKTSNSPSDDSGLAHKGILF